MDDLKGEFLLEWGLDLFNSVMGVIYSMLGVNPTEGTYVEAWNTVSHLYNVFLGIGGPLLVIFFVWGWCREAIDIRAELQFEGTVKILIRYIITSTLMSLFIVWFPLLCDGAIGLMKITNNSSFMIDSEEIAQVITDNVKWYLGLILGFIFLLVSIACAVMLIWSVLGRFLNMFIIIPFASIAISTIAGGGEISRTGHAYIKTMLVYIFEIVLMGIVLAITGSFFEGSMVLDSGGEGTLVYVEALVKMITVSAAMKSCDSLFRRAFNL